MQIPKEKKSVKKGERGKGKVMPGAEIN